MGLFDPLIIPAQQGDWIYVEWYPKNNCDMIHVEFKLVIGWRKVGRQFYPVGPDKVFMCDVLDEPKHSDTHTKVVSFVRGGLLFADISGDAIGTFAEHYWTQAVRNCRDIQGHIPAEFEKLIEPAKKRVEERRKLDLGRESAESS